MVSASKILTVSYGTFSCTLDGFDDPFTTMKAITEYFRILAEEDRYFGAEPATPDSDMLKRIAQQNNSRRIDAEIDPNGVILRQDNTLASDSGTDVVKPESKPAKPALKSAIAEDGTLKILTADQPVADDSVDTVSEKLERIRAVVAKSATTTANEAASTLPASPANPVRPASPASNGYTEDQHADEFFAKSAPSSDITSNEDINTALATEAAEVAQAEAERVETERLAAEEKAEAERLALEAQEKAEAEEKAVRAAKEQAEAARVKVEAEAEAELLAAQAEAERQAAEEKAEAEAELRAAQTASEAEVALEEIKSQSSETEFAADDFEAALTAELSGEAPVKSPEVTAPEETPAETVDVAPAETADVATEAAATIKRRSLLEVAGIDDSAQIERILEDTNDKLGDEASRRRHDALAHLKAAVAATKAEEAATGKHTTVDGSTVYRDDLAKVVRPVTVSSTEKPVKSADGGKTRPAPLVLVSEQRVKSDEEIAARLDERTKARMETVKAAATPGTVVQDEDDYDATEMAFADFVAANEATTLAELLEAAAVFEAYVEGREHFSRPMILRRVAGYKENENENVPREDILRAYGELLRDEVLQKIERGRFVVSADSKYIPKRIAKGA